jgi:alkaline phosphatase D
VITGDKHLHSVRNVPAHYADLKGHAVATEFVGSSIASQGDEGLDPSGIPYDGANNPHILWGDRRRGWVRAEVDPAAWKSDFHVVATSIRQHDDVRFEKAASYAVANGSPGAIAV